MKTVLQRLAAIVALLAIVAVGLSLTSTKAHADFPSFNGSTVIDDFVTCGTTATQLPAHKAVSFLVELPTGGATTEIGGASVTVAHSAQLDSAHPSVSLSLPDTSKAWCIVTSGTQELKIIGEGGS